MRSLTRTLVLPNEETGPRRDSCRVSPAAPQGRHTAPRVLPPWIRAHWLARACVGLLGALALLAFSGLSSAQVDAERFKPAATPDGWVNAEGSGLRSPADPWELGLVLNYAVNPLVISDEDGNVTSQIVGARLGVDVLASFTIAKPFTVGLDLPVFMAQRGDYDPSFAGIGDVRIVPKLQLLDDRVSPLGIALVAELRVPTHSGDFSGGARNVTFVPKAVFDHRFASGIRLGFNVGAALRERALFANVEAGHEFVYAAALGYRIGGSGGDTEIGIEFDGAVGLAAADKEELPLEGFAYVRHDLTPEWEIMGGPGVGLVPGYGVPTFRVFAGVRYRPTSHDQDYDGISDDEDACPDVAEDRDGYQDGDGCPEEDPDADHDGVPDWDDECPTEQETINGADDDDGCPDYGDPRVIYEEGRFRILDPVHFEHGSSEISEDSHELLDQVALTVKAHPSLRVRVEGHTDDTGPADVNQRLSQERANNVKRYLINRGVSARRLDAKGYGEEKLLVRGTSDDARSSNRRVEFIVTE